MSGCSSVSTRLPQRWNSNVSICASDTSPTASSTEKYGSSSPLLVGMSTVRTPGVEGPGCFLKKQAESAPRGHRTMLRMRPDA